MHRSSLQKKMNMLKHIKERYAAWQRKREYIKVMNFYTEFSEKHWSEPDELDQKTRSTSVRLWKRGPIRIRVYRDIDQDSYMLMDHEGDVIARWSNTQHAGGSFFGYNHGELFRKGLTMDEILQYSLSH